MEDTYTTAEIAAALGITVRSVTRRAGREAWPSADGRVRGGGRMYPLASLPADVREALARVSVSEAATAGRSCALRAQLEAVLEEKAAESARQEGLAKAAGLPERARLRAEARAAVLQACQNYIVASGMAVRPGRVAFCALYNAKKVDVSAEVRAEIPTVCPGSLGNWARHLAEGGLVRLAGKYGEHLVGTGIIDSTPELREFVLAMLVEYPHGSGVHVLKGIEARFPDMKVRCQDSTFRRNFLRGLQRWVKEWKRRNQQLHVAITNPDAWRSRFQAAGGSASAHVVRLNQRWEMDSTQGDVMLADGKRHVVIGLIDVYTRRIKLHVARTSSTAGVLSLLRRGLLDWGQPETLVTDNGSDYVSRQTIGVLAGLDILHDVAPPFTPQYKPHIERAFGTFSHGLLELCSGFIGHSVAERKDIEARKSFAQRLMHKGETLEMRMTPEELQTFCDRWTEDIYAHDPHEGLGGRSPWQVTTSWTEPVRRIADDRALDMLLYPLPSGDGWRTVRKKGLKLPDGWYDHQALGGLEGQRVKVFLDESDIGAVYVFAPAAGEAVEFVCRAVCPEIAGVSRQAVAVARREKQRKVLAQQKEELRATARAANTKDIAREILESRAVEARKLSRLPQPTVPHETEALRQAGAAARVGETPKPANPERQDAARETARASVAATVHELPTTRRQRFARWLSVDQALAAGEAVSAEDRAWWGTYQTTSEFRGEKALREFTPAQAAK